MSEEIIGPSLPPQWTKSTSSQDVDSDQEEDNGVIGPALPPNYQFINNSNDNKNNTFNASKTSDKIIGPTLPTDFQTKSWNQDNYIDESDSDSNEIIGPMPPTHKHFRKQSHKFINSPSIASMNAKNNQKEVTKREEWMTEIPKPLARKLGIKSVHQFSQKSSKNIDIKSNDDNKFSTDCKNKEMTQLMDSYNKRNKRNVSLLDIHKEERKKSKSSDKCKERVPFDPEKDLAVQKMDSKQTKSVIDKAQAFNDRFSLGTNKFL